MSKLRVVTKYLIHQWKSNNRHGIHSPFVYDFLEQVLYADKKSTELNELALLKSKLLKDHRRIHLTDLGAGSNINSNTTRNVKDIAKNSSKHPKYGRLFYRMVQYFKPDNIIELGTSLGLSTIYFATANPNMTTYTLEGCPNTLDIAKENFQNSI